MSAPALFDTPRFNAALFFPRADTSPTPPGSEDLFVEVPDARLHVRLHPGPRAARLLLFHGNGEVVADYDDLARAFAQAGAALAVVDFRGYGQSSGTPTLRAALDDAGRVLEAVARASSAPLLVMGRSLGGACAAHLAQTPHPRVAGFVFESAGSSLEQLVRRRGLDPAGITPEDRVTFDPLPKLRRCEAKALVLHGARDTLIDAAEAQVSHQALRGSRLALIPGRGHNDVSANLGYWEALAAFIAEVTA